MQTVDEHRVVALATARHVSEPLDERVLTARDTVHGCIV
jgi:hypothetical protein